MKEIKFEDLLNNKNHYNFLKNIKKFPKNKDRILLIEQCISIIFDFLNFENKEKNNDMNVIKGIISRSYITIHSSIVLLANNLEFSALMILRDVVENENLLNYFLVNPNQIQIWSKMNRKERLKKFSPGNIRSYLSANNPQLLKILDIEYKTHSEEFSHFTPRSLLNQHGLEYTSTIQSNVGLTICLHDIACHSHRLCNILVTKLLSDEYKHSREYKYFLRIIRTNEKLYHSIMFDQIAISLLFRLVASKAIKINENGKIITSNKNDLDIEILQKFFGSYYK